MKYAIRLHLSLVLAFGVSFASQASAMEEKKDDSFDLLCSSLRSMSLQAKNKKEQEKQEPLKKIQANKEATKRELKIIQPAATPNKILGDLVQARRRGDLVGTKIAQDKFDAAQIAAQ